VRHHENFHQAIEAAWHQVPRLGHRVDPGRWQGVPTEGKPDLVTVELLNYSFQCPTIVERTFDDSYTQLGHLAHLIQPNLPWADDHFDERVSRVPSNPGEQYKNWPWWNPVKQEVTAAHPDTGEQVVGDISGLAASRELPGDFKFTHTYQERIWAVQAMNLNQGRRMGIRYEYGDLDDLVQLLLREPYTRQAYLPIFFPEDTGAVHGGRTPCTLGYHFLLRDNEFHMWYTIRSCDLVRHFQDDIYLAARLQLWVLAELVQAELRSDHPQVWVDVRPGMFFFQAFSLHYHKGDEHYVRAR